MPYPPLLSGKTPAEYRSYFEAAYCRGPIETFDGIKVRFRKRDFNHCFFESVKTQDDTFSRVRAERLLWMGPALQDADAEIHVGWDNRRKQPAPNRRVVLVKGNYVVVIRLSSPAEANFVTAFLADVRAVSKIRGNPLWPRKNR